MRIPYKYQVISRMRYCNYNVEEVCSLLLSKHDILRSLNLKNDHEMKYMFIVNSICSQLSHSLAAQHTISWWTQIKVIAKFVIYTYCFQSLNCKSACHVDSFWSAWDTKGPMLAWKKGSIKIKFYIVFISWMSPNTIRSVYYFFHNCTLPFQNFFPSCT